MQAQRWATDTPVHSTRARSRVSRRGGGRECGGWRASARDVSEQAQERASGCEHGGPAGKCAQNRQEAATAGEHTL